MMSTVRNAGYLEVAAQAHTAPQWATATGLADLVPRTGMYLARGRRGDLSGTSTKPKETRTDRVHHSVHDDTAH